jgi:hypothetical protein
VDAGARNSVQEIAYVSAPQAALGDQVAAAYNKAGTVKKRAGSPLCAGTHLNRRRRIGQTPAALALLSF